MKTFYSFSLFFLLFVQISFSQVVWNQYQGPYAGHILSYAIKGDVLFAGADLPGVYRSLDNGLTWQATGITEGNVTAMHVFGEKVFACLTNTLYLSEDDGQTWVENANLSVINFYTYQDNLFAGTYSGVYKYNSVDDSWENSSDGLPSNVTTGVPIANSITSIDNVLFCATNHEKLYSSIDNGQTWSDVPGSSSVFKGSIYHLTNFNNELFVFHHTQGDPYRVYKSADQGATWTGVAVSTTNYWLKGAAELDGLLLMATDKGVFSYDDTSTSFELFNEKAFESIFSNGSVLMASNSFGLYKWDATESDFLLSNTGINSARIHGMSLFNESLYCATAGGVYFTADDGLTWNAIEATAGLYCTSVTKLDDLLYVSTGEGVLATSISDDSWRSLNTGLFSNVVWEIMVVENDLYAATDAGLFRSVDKGENWIYLENYDSQFLHIAHEGDLILAATYNSGMYKVSDDRTAMELVAFNNHGAINTVVILDGTIFVSVSNDGIHESVDGLYKSVDGGETWEHSDLPDVHDMFKRGDSNLYAAGRAKIFYSPNNGVTWDTWTEQGMPDFFISSILQGEGYMYAGTTGKSIYSRKYLSITDIESDEYTLGDGTISDIPDETTAEELLANIEKPHGSSINVNNEAAGESQDVSGSLKSTSAEFVKIGDVVLVVAEDGVTQKRYIVQTPSSLKAPKNLSLAIFPNPASDKLYFSEATFSNARVQIFDMEGKKLAENLITDGFIEISNLPKGIYITKIIRDGDVWVSKFVKE